jgi:hypothetical protein
MTGFLDRHPDDAQATQTRVITPGAWTMMHDWYPSAFSPTYNNPLTLGLRLTTSEDGYVTKVLFAKSPDNTGSHTATVWGASGQVLGQQLFTNETADGWQEVTLASPVRILAGETFTVGFSLDNHVFSSQSDWPRRTSGPLSVIGYGFYNYSSDVSAFPNGTTWTNYGIDLEFMSDVSSPTTSTTTTTSTTSTTTSTTTTTTSTTTTTTTTTAAPIIAPVTTPITTTVAPTTTTSPPTTTTSAPTTTTTVAPTTSTSAPSATVVATATTVADTTAPTTSTSIGPTPTTSIPDDPPPVDPTAGDEISVEDVDSVIESLDAETLEMSEVASIVDQLLTTGVNGDQATDLAASPAVLASIDPGQAAAIFEEIPVDGLSADQEAELVAAVTDAPTNIKNAFEAEIDVYGAGLDAYVPVGSSIDVGDRRTLIAATTAVATIASGVAAGAASTSGGSSSAPRDGGGSRSSGEVVLPGMEEDVARRHARKMTSRNSRRGTVWYRDVRRAIRGDTTAMEAFRRALRVIVREISALAFTLAGSIIVFFTLSGQTRRIALIATVIALVLHFTNAILENNKEST